MGITDVLGKIFGTKNEREIKKLQPIVAKINSLEPKYKAMSDEELRSMTAKFKTMLENGATLDDILPDAFAVVREAGWRTLRMRHFNVQLIGGIVLHQGKIAEMKTGEGKTLVATLPLYLNALEGLGCHLVTVNDYLAQRDAEWMGKIYRFLGLTVGVIVHDMSDSERKKAYQADITYGTNNEFGFDYLRDNMKFSIEEMVHRYYDFGVKDGQQKIFNYAIVDEVDSILIDEARTPLIISGPSEESTDVYYQVDAVIPRLRRDQDYIVDEKARSVTLTDSGIAKVEKLLGLKNLYDIENSELVHRVNQALKAHVLFKRDINYLVENGKVVIIDEFTGRKMPGRRWSDGLHQAIEAKEGLKIEGENQTLATITFQNYFRMYRKLAGMTGTAETEAEEFAKIYDLDVVVIPTNKPLIRKDLDDVVYKTERAKFKAVVQEIKEAHAKGQPVLVGTTNVEKSELLSKLLQREGIPHHVLNAKNHAREAEIVAQAGRKGAVTISTNMAGRGTDIVLGGNPEGLAKEEARRLGIEEGTPEFEELLEKYKAQCEKEKEEVLKAGGLYVIGTERHESRRIDNQLRGRSGRQGDPGKTRFFLSLEDELLRVFGGDRVKGIMDSLNIPEDEPITHKWITKSIESAQKRVEAQNFEIRKNLLDYDDVMNQQRQTIYGLRFQVLKGEQIPELIDNAIEQVALMLCDKYCPMDVAPEEWDFDGLITEVKGLYGLYVDVKALKEDLEKAHERLIEQFKKAYKEKSVAIVNKLLDFKVPPKPTDPEELEGFDLEAWQRDYEKAKKEVEKEWHDYEKEQFLKAIDTLWKAHLLAMDHLREGVYLEAYAQKDPKIIYKKEGFEMFKELLDRIHETVVQVLFRSDVQSESELERVKRWRRQAQMYYGHGTGPGNMKKDDRPAGNIHAAKRRLKTVGRNDPCPCGSGKKYKKCCMPKDLELVRQYEGVDVHGA